MTFLSTFLSDKNALEDMDELANIVLNKSCLNFNGEKINIVEIEFYIYSSDFQDEYVHRCERQKCTCWYLHRYRNGTLKNGTFKGLDYCFGTRDKYMSFLIRTIQLNTGEYVSGPCKLVDHLLKISDLKLTELEDSKLFIEDRDEEDKYIFTSSRVGLSDKYLNFKDLPFRYLTSPNIIKKNRDSIVKNLRDKGKSVMEIVNLTGYRKSSVEKWLLT
jgi:hypothetical protein